MLIDETEIKEILTKSMNAIDYILNNVSLLAAVILLLGYNILNQLDKLPSFFTPQTTILSYGITITLFFVGLSRKINDAINHIEAGKVETKNTMYDIKKYEDEVKTELVKLNTTLTEKCDEDAKVQVITKSDELYEKLGDAIKNANNRVLIMHLDPHSPEYHDNSERTAYFNLIFDLIKRKPQITMKRITSLCELEKAQWLWRIMEDTRGVERLDIAYINIPNLEKMFLSTVVSCQIIDEDKIFLLNPMCNTVPACGTCGESLYIESKKVVEVYAKYYDRLWDHAQLRVEGCCVLKSGKNCDFVALTNIIDKLKRQQTNPDPAPQIRASSVAPNVVTN
jgi:hypothetical protein